MKELKQIPINFEIATTEDIQNKTILITYFNSLIWDIPASVGYMSVAYKSKDIK